MTNAIVATAAGAIASADNDQMLVDLFIATKRSPHTRVQYGHSIRMLTGFTGKPLQAVTLQDAVNYHDWLKAQYSAGSVRLHVNVAKALCAFGVKLNYLRTNVFAVIKPDAVPEVTHNRILTEEETLKLIDAPARSQKGGALDESQVHRIVKAAAATAGISGDASAHWLRHSHASHSLDRGASLVTVRDTLGHASIATTNKYLHSKRKDSSALHLAV